MRLNLTIGPVVMKESSVIVVIASFEVGTTFVNQLALLQDMLNVKVESYHVWSITTVSSWHVGFWRITCS